MGVYVVCMHVYMCVLSVPTSFQTDEVVTLEPKQPMATFKLHWLGLEDRQ